MNSSTEQAPPVCPRHPDTVAYVRCQRCDRPTCPACQVPRTVGVHCVDCARQSQAGRRQARTLLGGTVVSGSVVTKVLIGLCVAAYAIQILVPALDFQLAFVPELAASEPWRFLTTAFLHANYMHLGFNMWALWVLGGVLEPVLGRWRFTAIYLLSALGGSTAIYWLSWPGTDSWITMTVGASGAVFGLFSTMFVVQRRFGRDTSGIVALLAINAVISFLGANISWQGHLGGLVVGGIVAAIYAWAPRGKRQSVGIAGTVAVAVVLVGLNIARALVIV
jgi:uncharacterized membrane protein